MFCPNCGTKNDDAALFCESCGTKLEDTPVTPVEPQETPVAPQSVPVTPQPQVNTQQAQFSAQPQFNAQQPQFSAQLAPKAKVSPLLFVTIGEAVLTLIMVIVFFVVGNNVFGYKNVAQTYFEAICAGDWDTAYDQLDIVESTFINKENFIASQKNLAGTEINQSKMVSSYDAGLTANVTLQYSERGASDISLMDVNLNKQKKRNFLFFPNWKVSSNQYVAKEFEVEVPAGAILYMDGVEVPSSMLTGETDYYDTYVLDRVFMGTHEFYCELGGLKSSVREYTISYDYDWLSVTDFVISQEEQEALIQLAYDNVKLTVDAAMNGKSFDEISSIYASDSVDSIRSDYEYWCDEFFAFDGKEGLIATEITSFEADFGSISVDGGKITAEVDIDYDYHDTFFEEDWWDGEITQEEYSSSDYNYIYFVYEDGQWKQSNSAFVEIDWFW